MKIRIAVLAAYASTLALAQPSYAAASNANYLSAKTDAKLEPLIVLAQSAPISTSRSNIKHPSKKAGSGTSLPSAAVNTSRSNIKHPSKKAGSGTPLPSAAVITSRSNIKHPRQKAGAGAADSSIFDRWGNSKK